MWYSYHYMLLYNRNQQGLLLSSSRRSIQECTIHTDLFFSCLIYFSIAFPSSFFFPTLCIVSTVYQSILKGKILTCIDIFLPIPFSHTHTLLLPVTQQFLITFSYETMVQCLFEYKSDWIFILKADFSLLAVCILLASKAFLIYIGLILWEGLENTAVERKEKKTLMLICLLLLPMLK